MSLTLRHSFISKYLDPSDVLGELLFGLIMALTFTLGAGLVVHEGDGAVREMLVAIISCNIAWGIIDAGMYLMTGAFERSRNRRLWIAVKATTTDEQALKIIRTRLTPELAGLTSDATQHALCLDVLQHLRHGEPGSTAISRDDWFGAAATFWLVFLSAIPAVAPFLIFDSRHLALRVSNGLLLGLMFLAGFYWAHHTHGHAWRTGFAMLICGGALVAVAIAFGA